jgi:hypothetical protein
MSRCSSSISIAGRLDVPVVFTDTRAEPRDDGTLLTVLRVARPPIPMPDMVRGSVDIKSRTSYAWCSRTLTVVLREECAIRCR